MSRKITAPSRDEPYEAVILGEPASKANSRKIAIVGGKVRVIKSEKALHYVEYLRMQIRPLTPMFETEVCVEMKIFYATRRPDLDESAILDGLQGRIYRNDRQVKRKVIEWGIDPKNPRTELRVTPFTPSL